MRSGAQLFELLEGISDRHARNSKTLGVGHELPLGAVREEALALQGEGSP
jgi:hypothetical protein